MAGWQESLIMPDVSIREAMRAIDTASLRMAFIVSDEKCLLGTITDGDIRRGLLKNLNMDDAALLVMNENPITAYQDLDKSHLLKIIEEEDLLCLPIITNSGVLVNVVTAKDLARCERRDNPVFVMAGGFGTRLRPLTDNCPKPMLPVGGKPILETLVTMMVKQGFHNFYFSTHFLPEIIKEHFGDGSKWACKINYLYESEPKGTGGALSLLPTNMPNLPMVVINGDILTDIDFNKLLDYHIGNKFDATMCLRDVETQVSYGVVKTEENMVLSMTEKPTYRHNINTGIYILSEKCFSSVPKNIKVDMPDHLKSRIAGGSVVGAMRHSGYWLDIGQLSDYQKAQADIHDLIL
jgi:dTDP-glucose pyrophosphorylase